MFSIIDHSSNR